MGWNSVNSDFAFPSLYFYLSVSIFSRVINFLEGGLALLLIVCYCVFSYLAVLHTRRSVAVNLFRVQLCQTLYQIRYQTHYSKSFTGVRIVGKNSLPEAQSACSKEENFSPQFLHR